MTNCNCILSVGIQYTRNSNTYHGTTMHLGVIYCKLSFCYWNQLNSLISLPIGHFQWVSTGHIPVYIYRGIKQILCFALHIWFKWIFSWIWQLLFWIRFSIIMCLHFNSLLKHFANNLIWHVYYTARMTKVHWLHLDSSL